MSPVQAKAVLVHRWMFEEGRELNKKVHLREDLALVLLLDHRRLSRHQADHTMP